MTGIKKITSIALAATMTLSLMTPAMATCDIIANESNKTTRIDYYEITENSAQKLTAHDGTHDICAFDQKGKYYDNIIEVPVSELMQNGKNITIVDLHSVQASKNLSAKARSDMADSIMQTLGYSDLAIKEISEDKKLAIIDGEEVAGVVEKRIVSDPSWGTTSTSRDTLKSVLTYTRRKKGELYIINNATWSGRTSGLEYRQSIAVQGFTMESRTSELEYSYTRVSANGTTKNFSGSYTETSQDGSYMPITDVSGTGVCYTYVNPASNADYRYERMMRTLSVTALVNNVNDGGAFNIYGNVALITMLTTPSISFPFGVSLSLGDSSVKHCQTQLTTKYA